MLSRSSSDELGGVADLVVPSGQQPAALVAQFSKSVSNYRFDGDDAVQQLKGDIESHNNKAVAFRWLAGHLFDQDYCLDRNDLVELEILKR